MRRETHKEHVEERNGRYDKIDRKKQWEDAKEQQSKQNKERSASGILLCGISIKQQKLALLAYDIIRCFSKKAALKDYQV